MPKGKQVLVTIGGKQFAFAAVLRAMNHEVREEVLQRLAAVTESFGLRGPRAQDICDIYCEVHRERFGEEFKLCGGGKV